MKIQITLTPEEQKYQRIITESLEKRNSNIIEFEYSGIENDKLTASEALYGFCGWLTSRDEKTIMSANDDAAPIAELVNKFSKVHNLEEPRDNFYKNLINMNNGKNSNKS